MKRRDFITYTSLTASIGLFSSRTGAVDSIPVWQSAAPMPIQSQELYPTVHGGKLFVAGGIAAKLGVPYFTNRVFSYDPSVNNWANEADLPEALHHAALVSTGNRLFLVGGFNGAYSHVWRMRENVYELTNQGWQSRKSLPYPQAEGVLTHHNGDIHLVSGQSPKDKDNRKRSDHTEVTRHLVWQANTASWETAAPIPVARNSATGGWIGDQMIVTGGRNSLGNFDHTHIYDKREDRWRSAAPLPLAQAGTASVVLANGIIVFGGEIFTPEAGVFKNVWRYDIGTDKWAALPHLPTPRHGLGAGRIGNQIYVIGGATQPGGSGTSDLNEVLKL